MERAWIQAVAAQQGLAYQRQVLEAAEAGNELARRLLALRPSLKILFMTGYSEETVFEQGAPARSAAILKKPFLAEALNRNFGERLSLVVIEPARWCARLDRHFVFNAVSPLEAAGRDADLAQRIGGDAGKRWVAVLNEAQMLLHAHPVNLARETRGEPAVNSVWLWGVGSTPQVASSRWKSVCSDDPIALGLARLAGASARRLPESASAWLESARQEGRHLALLDALRAPLALGQSAEYGECIATLERSWFAPLLAALRAGQVGMVTVHVPDSLGASFETVRADLWRFWRRPRSLEKYLSLSMNTYGFEMFLRPQVLGILAFAVLAVWYTLRLQRNTARDASEVAQGEVAVGS